MKIAELLVMLFVVATISLSGYAAASLGWWGVAVGCIAATSVWAWVGDHHRLRSQGTGGVPGLPFVVSAAGIIAATYLLHGYGLVATLIGSYVAAFVGLTLGTILWCWLTLKPSGEDTPPTSPPAQ